MQSLTGCGVDSESEVAIGRQSARDRVAYGVTEVLICSSESGDDCARRRRLHHRPL